MYCNARDPQHHLGLVSTSGSLDTAYAEVTLPNQEGHPKMEDRQEQIMRTPSIYMQIAPQTTQKLLSGRVIASTIASIILGGDRYMGNQMQDRKPEDRKWTSLTVPNVWDLALLDNNSNGCETLLGKCILGSCLDRGIQAHESAIDNRPNTSSAKDH
ncbi:hypothetical protein OBBRIDRAFT_807596 [Obba rivulosa]|uniref:Uncharacterized protein n=1 Tax=Obba rivulosa TaxID=1052685 RepID=A0A8E2AIW9_9APHY|nr:hypothetical protein OBBRIDRAFT_807596 [Obba rivulosa]